MPLRRILFGCYAASGSAALIYQVVWVRLFGLALGHTVASSSIVLAAFMCGLAAGAAGAARFPVKPARSLSAYAILEVSIALFALGLPTALRLAEPLLALAYADGEAPVRFVVIRAAFSFVLLGIPAAAMGATFPLAVAWLSLRAREDRSDADSQAAASAGRLYVANTAGAAVGAVAAGFWLIPSYGMRGTTWTAVALNLLSAAVAFRLSRAGPPPPAARKHQGAPGRARRRIEPAQSWPAVAAIAAILSGFAALAFEVSWSRLIALIIGPTTYAFAIMAASFIVGISLGSHLGLQLARNGRRRPLWLCASLVTSAAGTMAAASFTAGQLPVLVAGYLNQVSGFGPLLAREALIIGITLVAASISFGATFTLALSLASAGVERAAPDTARVYALNTLGAVAGALAGGFLLLPRFGIEGTFLVTSRALTIGALVIAAVCAFRLRTMRAGASALAVAAALVTLGTFTLPRWDRDLLAGGLYKYSRGLTSEDIAITTRAGRLEYYKEGAAGTVSVKSVAGTRSMAIDGKVDASNGGDMLTQRMLGVMPMLAHQAPQSVLVIGHGSGVTAAAAIATRPVQRLDIVEISPEVIEASALFEPENGRVLHAPGVRVLLGDGRTHLQLAERRYDVIVSEPSNPWMAGVAALFTREFFEGVRARLTADGIFCQWTHTYELEASDLRSIVGTFAAVFPNGTMWLVGDGDLLLIGARNEQQPILDNIEHRSLAGPLQTLVDQGVAEKSAAFFLLSLYAGGRSELAAYAGQSELQADNRMSLEFSAARAMYEPPAGSAARLRAIGSASTAGERIRARLSRATAADWTNRGDVASRAEAFEMAHDSYRRAAELDRRSLDALRGATAAAAALGRLDAEITWLRGRSQIYADHPAVMVALSSALAMNGQLDAATTAAIQASRVPSHDPMAFEQLAAVAADAGDVDRLQVATDALTLRFPTSAETRYYRAALLFLKGHAGDARTEVDQLLVLEPAHARGQNLKGILCAGTRDFACARSAFQASILANPRDASAYTNLGNTHLEAGDHETAARLFREAVAVDPGATAAKDALRAIAPR